MTSPENIPETSIGFSPHAIVPVVPAAAKGTAASGDASCIESQVRRPAVTRVWNIDFAQLDMEGTLQFADDIIQLRRPEYFITANLNYAMLTDETPRLAPVNESAAAIIADGNPIVWRSRLNASPLPCRVAGSDMISALAELSSIRGYRVFFLGGEPGVAQAAADALSQRFPTFQVAGCYAPPFRALTDQEHQELVERIQEAGTDILFVAFGQPKGELWIYENYEKLGVPLSIQLGASFDFLAGTAKRAPKFWQWIACEWLYRALQQPTRLLPRYTKNFTFLCRVLMREMFGIQQKDTKG